MKDIYAWCAWAESCGFDPVATTGLLDYNKKLINLKGVYKQS